VIARVLIVEDEALVALDIARQLTEAGLTVVGPTVSVAGALQLIGKGGCDAAVLDINLGCETSEPVAQELRTKNIPFVILTGYAKSAALSGYDGASVISKPVRPAELIATLLRCLRQS
jgi:two-component system, response regulator PdtaR